MQLNKSRMLFVSYFLGLMFCILIIRSASLQLFPHTRLTQLKERLFETTVKITPRRGVIYDRYGKPLAISVPSQSLFADPYRVKQPYYVAKKLSSVLKLKRKLILSKLLNTQKRFVWIKRHLSEQELVKIKSFKLEGLHFLKESKRFYTKGRSLSQVLGFTDIDGNGLEGIEKKYDQILQGEEQRVLVKRDARGRLLFADFTPFIQQVSGFDVYLTIDSALQFYFEKELSRVVRQSQATSAMGVILSIDHSEVLSMVNIPNYDPNHPNQVTHIKHRRNRVITDVFEPGSILKSFAAIAALQSGMSPSKAYPTHNGKLKIGNHTISEADTYKQFDSHLDMTKILSYSSNVGAALMALDIGPEKLRQTLFNFGFGQKTGIDFQGEAKGLLRKLPWRPIETATVGFGHGISGTALQAANAYAAIARGGLFTQPRLIKQIRNAYNAEEKTFKEKVIRRVLTEEEAQTVTLMLTAVTEKQGTGFQARVPGYLTAGKTGTAQKVDLKKGGYKDSEYISSFIGFIPAHKAKYVIYVVIDGAQKDFYASTVAAPVFSKVSSYAVRKAGLSPMLFQDKNFILTRSNPNQKKTKRNLAFVNQVPNLKGLTLREVLSKVQNQDIRLKIHGSNRVIRTIPFAGEPIPSGKTITVILN